MKYYYIIILMVFMSSARGQSTEEDFLAGKLSNPEEVTMLFLEDKNLTELPDSFDKLINLETIYLNGNQLVELPKSFVTLKNLKTIDLSDNKLTKLPENFGNLKKLELLSLDNNQLTTFDPSICSLKELNFLHISNNQMESIPDCIADLPNLGSLGISGNSFANFPASVLKLSKLEVLLYENDKDNLPNLKSLKKLKKLFIDEKFYAKNKSNIKALLPSGCKVNPASELPPPIMDQKITEGHVVECFVNVVKTETKNKVETIENLFEFGYNNQEARIVITKTLHEGENIRQKIEDAKKEGDQIVPLMTTELLNGTFSIEDKVITFKGNDSNKTVKKFKISYKAKTKTMDQLTEVGTSKVYKTGPCFAPMPSMGN